MGCGKSKHDVVADTIKKSKAEQETSNAKSVKIVHEKAINGDIDKSLGIVDNAKPDNNGETTDATKVYMKEEIHDQAKDSKVETLDQPKIDDSSNYVAEAQRHEVLIPGDSPKEDGNIEGVITDGISGKTTYYSPSNDKENAPVDQEMTPETKTALAPTLSEEVEVKEQLPVTEKVEAVTQVIIPDRKDVVPTTTTEETEVMTPVKEEVVVPTTTTEKAEVITKEVPVEEEVVPLTTTAEVVVTEETPALEEGVPTTQGETVPVSNEDIAAETKEDVPKIN